MKTAWICGAAALLLIFASGGAGAQNIIEALPGEEAGAPPTPPPDSYGDDAPVEVDKSWMTYSDPYTKEQLVISSPHRTPEEVSEWLKALASDLMTHTPEGIVGKVQGYRPAFSEKGYREYVTYLTEAKVFDMVSLRKNALSTIANGDVAFAGSGATGGVYTWLAYLPLLISFYQLDENGEQRPVAGGSFRLEARISRTNDESAPEGMVIDGWRVVRATARP
jgi:hypothetical protein